MFAAKERLWGKGGSRTEPGGEGGFDVPSHEARTLLTVATALALLASPAAARAGMLASGYLLSSNAVRFSCRVLNVGGAEVKIKSAKVVLPSGTPFTDTNNCGASLLPGQSCSFSGPSNHMAGIFTVEGATKHLRVVCMLLTAGNNLVASTEMR